MSIKTDFHYYHRTFFLLVKSKLSSMMGAILATWEIQSAMI